MSGLQLNYINSCHRGNRLHINSAIISCVKHYNLNTAMKKYCIYGPSPSSSISLVFITAVLIGNTLNRLKDIANGNKNLIKPCSSLFTRSGRVYFGAIKQS